MIRIAIAVLLIAFALPAYADDSYESGYNSGYYTGAFSGARSTDYGRGVEQGSWDAFQEDRQRAQAEEGAAMVHEQEERDAMEDMVQMSRADLNKSVRQLEEQAREWNAAHAGDQ